MCVAMPGKLIKISEDGFTGTADFSGNIIEIGLALPQAKVGDWVLVHAGVAIDVLEETTAQEITRLFEELSDENQ